MSNIGLWIWAVVATVLAGAAIVVVLVTPKLAENEMSTILPAVAIAIIAAIPISWVITKKLKSIV